MNKSDALNQSVIKGLRVLEALFEDGFAAKTKRQIIADTGLAHSSTWRQLKTLEHQGWIVEVPAETPGQVAWRLSDKLIRISIEFKKHTLAGVQATERDYLELTGEILRNE